MSSTSPVPRAEFAIGTASAKPATHKPVPGRIPELDGLRGIAILLVVLFHFNAAFAPSWRFAQFFQIGWIGVDLFFVLSGYLITGILLDSVGRPGYYFSFITRRTLRIFPVYYACLILYCVLTYIPKAIEWNEFWRSGGWWYAIYLGNVKNFVENSWPALGLLTPLWSLQVEEQFYLSFPFVVRAASRTNLARILMGSVIAALGLRIVLTIALPSNLLGTYTLMPCRMDPLAMGGLIAIARREWPERLKSFAIPAITIVSSVAFLGICYRTNLTPWSNLMRTIGYTALDLAFAGLLVIVVSARPRGLLGILRFPFLVWLGMISYGVYLLQVPAELVTGRWLTPLLGVGRGSALEFLLALALVMGTAWLSWRFFESPILRLRNRRFGNEYASASRSMGAA